MQYDAGARRPTGGTDYVEKLSRTHIQHTVGQTIDVQVEVSEVLASPHWQANTTKT